MCLQYVTAQGAFHSPGEWDSMLVQKALTGLPAEPHNARVAENGIYMAIQPGLGVRICRKDEISKH